MRRALNHPQTKRTPLALLCCCVSALILPPAASAQGDLFAENIRKTDPRTPADEQTGFHLPPGFEIQLVAADPDIAKPMNIAFDARGRLWVAQSREYPYAAPLDKPARDAIKVLSDFDQKGRARKITTFAEGLNIPIGLYPYKNGVIALSIPNIYFFEDTDGDGKADRKELILGRQGFERDTHGLTSSFRRGFDGWIYADHGYNNNTTLTAKDGSTITMNSGNTYRFKPDGSRVEQFTWGQVNPFGLMFDPLGDLWSADCHSSPVYQLLRGAYYPSFGKPHDGLGFGPDVCRHAHGSTAIAGIAYYAAENFPPEFRGNTFIGNVMTSRINRDSYLEQGSTRIAKEEPDFVSSDDPWFRPVDLQLGPDGAIYVADFYNRIIGHYEVPLDHPGRDRGRGRIWRIVYTGGANSTSPTSKSGRLGTQSSERFLLALPTSPEGLVSELANPNLTRRMLAMNELADRIGKPAITPLRRLLGSKNSGAVQKAHALWVLHRLAALDEKTLVAAARDSDRLVRVHAMRILSETSVATPTFPEALQQLVFEGLKDEDAHVQRAAADALGQHTNAFGRLEHEAIFRLLDLRQQIPAQDSQLLHVCRMALRNQLQPLRIFPFFEPQNSKAVADVATGIPTEASASFLLGHVQKHSDAPERLATYLRHIARYAAEREMPALAAFTRKRFADDLDFQLTLFKSIQEGTVQRGGELPSSLREWGAELPRRLLVATGPASLDWRNSPIKGADTTNPWFLEPWESSDGDKSSRFICSFSPGGEKFTGVLRSKSFSIPAKLSFFIAGHDGLPGQPLQKKNFIRLRAADSNEVLAESAPPRNDIAQLVTWDLAQDVGKGAFLEVVDGNTANAYAWLAVGRFRPEVVALPKIVPSAVDKWQQAAAEIAGLLRLRTLEPQLVRLLEDENANPDARAAAAKSLASINPEVNLATFGRILSNADEPMKLRERIASTLGEVNSPESRALLAEALRSAPRIVQSQIAVALASTLDGAEALLQTVSDGKASAYLLQERAIKDRLSALKSATLAERIANLTQNLRPPSVEKEKLLAERRAAFNAADASASRGADVFKQTCAVCHAIDGQGAVIGPQLDGIGNRGAERLIEDVLDPNRNVDRAFRSTIFVLNDGDVQSGLFRREEGEVAVIAESTGKEISIPKKDIKERRESDTSLMPDNFSDVIPMQDFNHLLAFLLSKAPKAAQR
jgi:putative heme-binding domain-containing protein